ncbi:MAG: lipid-A-disaccharide synthase [Dissulfurispiraceae bacterium]|jgi:lipid-A-disaccharide synthase
MLERVMIIAGESSGELYGALLANALKSRNPGLRISGVGGERMASAGVELISTIASSFGLVEAIRTFGKIKNTFQKVVAAFTSFAPQVVVLIDYPDFNIPVAREAKKRSIKVLYYVSPQVWAWRTKRVATIGRLVDSMAVILPFEADLYRGTGVPCEFVGHPVMDEIAGVTGNSVSIKAELGLRPDRPVMALLPGSRPHEVRKLLPVLADAAAAVTGRSPGYQFVMPVAPNLSSDVLSLIQNELKGFTNNSLLITDNAIKALLCADIALIASGTATLQAALLGVPMVVVYKLSPFTYFVGRLVVKVKHISLANILLDKSVRDDSGLRITELLQGKANIKNIMEEFARLSDNQDYKNNMLSQMEKVRALFLNRNATARVAGMVEQLSNA